MNLSRKELEFYTGSLGLRETPGKLPDEIITAGNPKHRHSFVKVTWDNERLGKNVCDIDEGENAKPGVAFPFATFKNLYRCSCGCEVVKSSRALI